ncbi:Zinc finger, RING-type [Sesbania bispinosa]|nr:Zinc finger, RING-type [Sesbania bispinosa]
MSQFNHSANWQNNNHESNGSSIFRMLSSNGSSDHQWEVPIVPGITIHPLEETALNNTISESMGMNVSSPMSSLPISSSGPSFPGRLFGTTILLDQLTPGTNTNTRTVSPTLTTQGAVVEIHSTGEHEVNSGGSSSHENEQSTGEVMEEEEEEGRGGVGGEDMMSLPFKRRSDHPLTIGEGSSNAGGGRIPRHRVEEANNTNTPLGGLPMNVGVGTESASAMVSSAAEQVANQEPHTTFVPTPTFINYDPYEVHLPFANQPPASPPCLVYSVVSVEHVPLFYQVQQGYPWSSRMLRPPPLTIPAPATATTMGSIPNHLRSPPQFGLRIGNGNSTPGPSTIPNRPLQVPNPNGWFRRVNVEEQYVMMPPPAANHSHAFPASLRTRQTSSTLTQINNNFPSGWLRLMAQNQRYRQLRDEVFNVLDYMRDNGLLQLEILEALENDQGFMDGLTEEQIMSHIGQEVVQSAPENQDTLENEICSICQEEYVNGEQLGRLDCGHKYHLSCIKQWLVLRNNCPICKQTALAVENDDDE